MQNNLQIKKIQYLTKLQVVFDTNGDQNLVMLETEGYSNDEYIGVPILMKKSGLNDLPGDGILEFDLVIEPLEDRVRKVLSWSTRIVFDLNEYPGKLRGIKVNALNNSDIVLVEQKRNIN